MVIGKLRKLLKRYEGKAFILQTVDEETGGGWVDVDPEGAVWYNRKPTRKELLVHALPGKRYRLTVRDMETGQYADVVSLGILVPGPVAKKPKREKTAPPPDPFEWLIQAAERIQQGQQAMRTIVGAVFPEVAELAVAIREGRFDPIAQSTELIKRVQEFQRTIAPPSPFGTVEFEGKLPAYLHPIALREITAVGKDLVDYATSRLSGTTVGTTIGAGLSSLGLEKPPKGE